MHYPIEQENTIKSYEINSLEDLPKLKTIMEAMELKPNFSEIARGLGVDRRTAIKYYNGYTKPKTREKKSKIDEYYPIIKELLSDDCIQVFHYKRHLWNYLVKMHDFPLTESALRQYINKNQEFKDYFDKKKKTAPKEAPMRFETSPGQQMQIDWKENFDYLTSDGEKLKLNVFSAVLGYSRYVSYHVCLDRKQETLFANLDNVFSQVGGVTKEILSDNMATIMDQARTANSEGKVNAKFQAFADDYGFEVRPCKAGRPSSKGKIETQMKLLDEIDAYQGKFTYEELVNHVQEMALRKNMTIHSSTGKAPLALWEKEKDFLLPLPCQEIRSPYYYHSTVKVNKSAMISYKANQYSVPSEYIGKILGLEVFDNTIFLYDSTNLVTMHKISSKRLNYHPDHYLELTKKTMPYKSLEEVEKISKRNLEKLGDIYGD